MALVSDAAHNFSDFTELLIAYFAFLSLKVRGAFLHMVGDMLTSLVLVNGLILICRPWYWLDTLLSLAQEDYWHSSCRHFHPAGLKAMRGRFLDTYYSDVYPVWIISIHIIGGELWN